MIACDRWFHHGCAGLERLPPVSSQKESKMEAVFGEMLEALRSFNKNNNADVIIEETDSCETEGNHIGRSRTASASVEHESPSVSSYHVRTQLLDIEQENLPASRKSISISQVSSHIDTNLDYSYLCKPSDNLNLNRSLLESQKVGDDIESWRTVACNSRKPQYPRVLESSNKFNQHSDISKSEFSPDFLTTLLNRTLTGQKILQRAKLAPLSNTSQNELCNIVAEYHLNLGRVTTEHFLNVYAEAIICLLDYEIKEDYFIPRKGDKKNPSGKLYNKITNLKQKRRNREKAEGELLNKRSKVIQIDAFCETPDLDDANSWLCLNRKPWNIVLEKWRGTHVTRKKLLLKPNQEALLFEKYPHYTETFGYQLVDIDFQLWHAGNIDGLKKLQYDLPKITKVLNRTYTDEYSKELLEYIQTPNINIDSCGIFITRFSDHVCFNSAEQFIETNQGDAAL
ncbi:uncharacterized protein LOC131428827 [Malaya genurostris]|uniref:uncharacterized protein LOC131428827 n=1 Tax=Malaya genurostris TaxID=325434 RepID=UPI0026F3C2EB|nr:uncharacterized protein LOC131428827 [Malaya genurostris]